VRRQPENRIAIETGSLGNLPVDILIAACYYVVMFITTQRTSFRTLKQDDPNFYIEDHFIRCPRAGFEINQQCPREYKLIISECIRNGWLKPIANITERELLFMGLSK
jgi:hypothetical protein